MKRTIHIWIIALGTFVLLAGNEAQAQQRGGEGRREEIRTMKIAFFTDALQLTPQESEKFWPVYNEYWSELRSFGHQRRDLTQTIKEGKTGEKELKEWFSIMESEQKTAVKYAEKFKAILPQEKVLKVFVADEEFKNYLIRQATTGRGGGSR